ncbi:MAG TPA: YetF domain-containing protein [Bacteroidia bacterium]|nr:YetF domain-containing protein [Bacteroidia bacterium]
MVDRFWGTDHLNIEQMTARAVVIFIIALIILRISGRRSFGMASAFDNVVAVLIGGVLSRAVVGASPFLPTVCAALAMALMHRLLAWLSLDYKGVGRIAKGSPRVIYENGEFNRKNMRLSLISERDFMEGVRKECNTESLDEIDKAYVERDGRISVIRKRKD